MSFSNFLCSLLSEGDLLEILIEYYIKTTTKLLHKIRNCRKSLYFRSLFIDIKNKRKEKCPRNFLCATRLTQTKDEEKRVKICRRKIAGFGELKKIKTRKVSCWNWRGKCDGNRLWARVLSFKENESLEEYCPMYNDDNETGKRVYTVYIERNARRKGGKKNGENKSGWDERWKKQQQQQQTEEINKEIGEKNHYRILLL